MRRKKGTANQKKKSFVDEIKISEVQVARKGSDQQENTESEKSASRQPDKQEVLNDPVNHLPDEKELKVTPKIVMSNLGTNAGWSAGTKALSQKKARNDCPIQGMVQEKTDKLGKRLESLENK